MTDRNPLGSFADPDSIANGIVFFAPPVSDYIDGHAPCVDRGQVPIDSWRLGNRYRTTTPPVCSRQDHTRAESAISLPPNSTDFLENESL